MYEMCIVGRPKLIVRIVDACGARGREGGKDSKGISYKISSKNLGSEGSWSLWRGVFYVPVVFFFRGDYE